jgi:hypothetical protein
VEPDLGPLPADSQDQVGARMHRGKPGYPDVLKQPEDGQFALLIDQGVIRENGEIEVQLRPPESTLSGHPSEFR